MVMQQQQQQQQQQHPLDELLWIIQIKLTCFRRYPKNLEKLATSLSHHFQTTISPNCKKGKTQHK